MNILLTLVAARVCAPAFITTPAHTVGVMFIAHICRM